MYDLNISKEPRGLENIESILGPHLKALSDFSKKLPDGRGEIDENDFDELRRRMKSIKEAERSVAEAFFGRKRPLVSYLATQLRHRGDTEAQEKWLPDLDSEAVRWIEEGLERERGLRSLACLTHLYFEHFGRDPEIDQRLAPILERNWSAKAAKEVPAYATRWIKARSALFHELAIDEVVRLATPGEAIEALCERLGISHDSGFRQLLHLRLLIGHLEKMPFGQAEESVFNEIEAQRTCRVGRRYLGARAVEVLVCRVQNKGGGWPTCWSERIVSLAGDPRRADQLWWGWANEEQMRVARNGITALNVEIFLEHLRNSLSANSHQWEYRERFLRDLLAVNWIEEVRIVIPIHQRHTLSRHLLVALQPAYVSDGSRSFICFRCPDDVCIIEGTESFALRAWQSRESFPLRDLFLNESARHMSRNFVRDDQAIWQAHQGQWISGLVDQIYSTFGLNWEGLRRYV